MTITYTNNYKEPRPILGSDIPRGQFFLARTISGSRALFHRGHSGNIYWVSDSSSKDMGLKNGLEKSMTHGPNHTFQEYEPVEVELVVTRSGK